ncbi:histidinol-phosphate transaminase [Glaciecola petra]|uniref:Histidinol-phosphate aminotransferase n=1 Tax=Glaciecola petra TaxID=3075602 RepID=A0ABU2ZQ30_9ALTE|nr:histidinol-phosphate transaminase [Aestuariibacter sp. P117]MDT0594735.1 histidinol-phosphate transaminase [Aestuariibacter sp. P117]
MSKLKASQTNQVFENTHDGNWLSSLCNDHVNKLTPYESARRLFSASEDASNSGQTKVWLNANEAPESEHYTLNSDLLNRYPDCQPDDVLLAYSQYSNSFFNVSNISKDNIVITRGADEGIELLIRAFCKPNSDAILICPPTYGMYKISADTFAVNTLKVPLLENSIKESKSSKIENDFSLDTSGIVNTLQSSSNVKLVFLCSPNNPTGTLINESDLVTILQASSKNCIVVVDEAYIEFSVCSSKQKLLNQFDNLVILRTLSKAYALAGIRCGFVLCSEAIKTILLKVIAPYPVPGPVAQIAAQALSQSTRDVMLNRVQSLKSELDKMTKALQSIDQVELVGKQCGNFVLFRSDNNKQLMLFLVENRMLIRDQSKQLLLNNCLRITVGTPTQNQQLLALIKTFFNQIQKEANS